MKKTTVCVLKHLFYVESTRKWPTCFAAMKDERLKNGVVQDIVLLACVGIKPILVHGGGPEINSWLTKIGIEPNFKNGCVLCC